jgi:hypothetical protein
VCFAVTGFVIARKIESTILPRLVWGVGGTLTLVYLTLPSLRRLIFVAWGYLTYPISWVLSHVLLVVIFWVMLTPIGLLARLLGYNPLHRQFNPSAASYWMPRANTDDFRRYFQQF